MKLFPGNIIIFRLKVFNLALFLFIQIITLSFQIISNWYIKTISLYKINDTVYKASTNTCIYITDKKSIYFALTIYLDKTFNERHFKSDLQSLGYANNMLFYKRKFSISQNYLICKTEQMVGAAGSHSKISSLNLNQQFHLLEFPPC